jgi:hypothetical protein
LRASEHIFTESAGDYYHILDGLARHPRWPAAIPVVRKNPGRLA